MVNKCITRWSKIDEIQRVIVFFLNGVLNGNLESVPNVSRGVVVLGITVLLE